ncbi:hypothetical protein ES703_80873 [subsurface metagenome]
MLNLTLIDLYRPDTFLKFFIDLDVLVSAPKQVGGLLDNLIQIGGLHLVFSTHGKAQEFFGKLSPPLNGLFDTFQPLIIGMA